MQYNAIYYNIIIIYYNIYIDESKRRKDFNCFNY